MSYVSRLRATIGGDYIVTHDNGYELVISGGSYDARDFEQALARARASAPGEAIAAYDRALAYWSGHAFGEDAEEWWLRGSRADSKSCAWSRSKNAPNC